MATKRTPEKARRRSPITREEGERRLIQATVGLLAERPIGEIGARDIAAQQAVAIAVATVMYGHVVGVHSNEEAMRVSRSGAASSGCWPNTPPHSLAVPGNRQHNRAPCRVG